MKSIPLYIQILAGMVSGALLGIFFPDGTRYIDWIGTLFMNTLGMLIVPIIFFSISRSISRIGEGRSLKRITLKTIGLYVFTMLIAVLTGILFVSLIHPGAGVPTSAALASEIPETVTGTSVRDIITGFIPSNIVGALSRNNTIPVIFIAFLTGYFTNKLSSDNTSALNRFLDAGYELTMKITEWVLLFAPLGIFAVVAVQFAKIGNAMDLIKGMLLYVLTVTAGLAFHTFITLPLMLRFGARVHPWKHFSNMSSPMITAFSTASSGATLPLTLEAVEKKDGVSGRIAQFTVSLGATINMNGAALLEFVAVMFIAQVYGIELSFAQMLVITLTSVLCAIGSAGIPMSAMVMLSIILSTVGLPIEGIGLVIGVDRILDMLRTAVNVYGDTCVAVMVAKSEKEKLTIDLNIDPKDHEEILQS